MRSSSEKRRALCRSLSGTSKLLALLVLPLCIGSVARAQIQPSIVAVPNGTVPKGQTEGNNVILWNAGSNYPYCEVYMTVNNGEETELGRGHDGKRSVTVRLGSTYVFKMIVYLGDQGEDVREVAKLTLVPRVAEPGTGTLGKRRTPGGSSGGGGRTLGTLDEARRGGRLSDVSRLPFFYNVRVVPQGDSFGLSFETREPSEFFIEASKQSPVADLSIETPAGQRLPAAFPPGTRLAAFTLPGLSGVKSQHQATVRSAPGQILEADALYHYVITAKAPDGSFRRYIGKFSNVSRTVTVVWERVKILEDSDPNGCGEIRLSFWANYGEASQAGLQINGLNNSSACTGAEYGINREFVIQNAPSTLKLSVSGTDDDTTFGSFTGPGVDPPVAGPLDNGDLERNVANAEFDLNQFEINTTVPFKLISVKPGEGQGDLMFEVYGRIVISSPR